MSKAVLDTSAVLAVLCKETGADVVMQYSQGALISTVNLAELFSKAADVRFTMEELHWAVKSLQLVPVPFDPHAAGIVGAFREPTRQLGLSIGDRACLALGFLNELPVLTADQDWATVQVGVEVLVIR